MHRTDTTDFATFTLPFPEAAIFDFTAPPSSTPLNAIRITIPPGSTWRMPLHRHPSEIHRTKATAACHSVTSFSGPLYICWGRGLFLGNLTGGTGVSKTFEPGLWVAWSRWEDKASTPLTAILIAEHVLWRNICSAIIDRDIFSTLTSTPFWLKGLFALLAFVPSWKARMLNVMLWTQLQTIFYAHDFHLYHGHIPLVSLWMCWQIWPDRPPRWVERLTLRSLQVTSRVVMTSAYWIGLFLGMKGEYEEYTPRGEHGREKNQTIEREMQDKGLTRPVFGVVS